MDHKLQISPALQSAGTVFALFSMLAMYLWPALSSSMAFNLAPDNEYTLGAMLDAIYKSIHSGHWPLRMETIMGGFPIYNNQQISPLYPFYYLFSGQFNAPIDLIDRLHYLTTFHLSVFCFGTFVFLRRLNTSHIAALVGTVFVALSPQIFGITKWANTIGSFCWLPLFLAALIICLEEPKRLRGPVFLVGAFFLMISAQAGQGPIYAVYFGIALTASRFWYLWRQDRSVEAKPMAKNLLFAGLVGIAICAPVIFPVLQALPLSIRWIHEGHVIGLEKIPFEKFLIDQLNSSDFSAIFFPVPNHRIITNAFIGIAPFSLAVFLAIKKDRHWAVPALVMIAIHSFLSVFGSNLGGAYLNYRIPLIDKIREPSYFLIPLSIAVGTLAALGIDAILNAIRRADSDFGVSRLVATSGVSVTLVLGTCAIALFQAPAAKIMVLAYTVASLLLCALPYVALRSPTGQPRKVANSLFLLALTVLALLHIFGPQKGINSVKNSQFLINDFVNFEKVLKRIKDVDPEHQYRVIFGGDIGKQSAAMQASFRGIRTLNSSIGPAPLKQFSEMYFHKNRPGYYFAGLGARYLVCRSCAESETEGFAPLFNLNEYSVYENRSALPNIYIAEKYLGEFSNTYEYEVAINKSGLTPPPLVVERSSGSGGNAGTPPLVGVCSITEFARNANEFSGAVSCRDGGVLVINEFHSPSWTAYIDGVQSGTLKVNGNQIGVPIHPGAHFIQVRYWPGILTVSLITMLVGVFIVLFRYVYQQGVLTLGLRGSSPSIVTSSGKNGMEL